MQTFVPEFSMIRSVQALDKVRLNNQINETTTIHRALVNDQAGWRNHPATMMWRDNTEALAIYGAMCCRTFAPTHRDPRMGNFSPFIAEATQPVKMPWWWGLAPMHVSHRLNLYFKDPGFYAGYKPDRHLQQKPPYTWPIHPDEYTDFEQISDQEACATVTRYTKPRVLRGLLMTGDGYRMILNTNRRTGQDAGWLFPS